MPDTKEGKEFIIFTYSLKHLLVKDKVRFYYALKGRDGKSGVVKAYQIEQLGRTVLLVPLEVSTKVEEFLQYWKCDYAKRRVTVHG